MITIFNLYIVSFVQESSTPEMHLKTVWEDYVKNSKAKYIAFVAHSYGGQCLIKVVSNLYGTVL